MGEVKVQGHNSGAQILLTRFNFVPCQPALPFMIYGYLKIWPWKSKVKVIISGGIVGPTFYRLIALSFCQSTPPPPPLPRYVYLKIWPWKSMVTVIGEVKVQFHIVGPISYRLTFLSFNVNRPLHSSDKAISKSDLENPIPNEVKIQVTQFIHSMHFLFISCQSAHPIECLTMKKVLKFWEKMSKKFNHFRSITTHQVLQWSDEWFLFHRGSK